MTHDPVIAAVQADLEARSALGLRKYGVGLDRRDMTERDWLQHAYEEALDLANYLKAALMHRPEKRGAHRWRPTLQVPVQPLSQEEEP